MGSHSVWDPVYSPPAQLCTYFHLLCVECVGGEGVCPRVHALLPSVQGPISAGANQCRGQTVQGPNSAGTRADAFFGRCFLCRDATAIHVPPPYDLLPQPPRKGGSSTGVGRVRSFAECVLRVLGHIGCPSGAAMYVCAVVRSWCDAVGRAHIGEEKPLMPRPLVREGEIGAGHVQLRLAAMAHLLSLGWPTCLLY